MPTIVHFDIPTDSIERAKKFYNALFGWKFEKWGGPVEYWLITTKDGKGKKGVGGGMMQRQDQQRQGILNYIDVNSVDRYMEKVKKLGGKVLLPKMAVPNVGYLAVCMDTENNTFGIFEENKKAK